MDLEYDETRALSAMDDIRKGSGLNLFISYEKRQWHAGLNEHMGVTVAFATVDEAIDWAYWYAGAYYVA